MALQFSTTLRNAALDQLETTIGTSPLLRIYTGTVPGIANAVTGTLLADITCPSDWAAAAASGSKAKSGTWQDTSADASGTPGYFRLSTSGGTAMIEGTCGVSSGDLSFDATISLGGTVTISTFTQPSTLSASS
jgi:hypothetical protein